MPEHKIECPCCKAEIIIDSESGGILSHTEFKNSPKSLEEWLKTDQTRSQDLANKFAEAQKKEDSKLELLQKKFERARKNKENLKEPPKPDIFWD